MDTAQATSLFEQALTGRKIHWVVQDSGYFYCCATDDKSDEGNLNPFFRLDSSTGEVSEFYVTQDFALFERIRGLVT